MSSTKTLSETSIDLAQCNAEKIHLIAKIQSHGVFLAITAADFKVKLVSENFSQLPEVSMDVAEAAIDRKLIEVLGESMGTAIIQQLRNGVLTDTTRYSFEYRYENAYEIYLFKMGADLIGIEIEPYAGARRNSEEVVREFVRKMKDEGSVEGVGKLVCRYVRLLTGLDRVMLYRFAEPTWHGEVIAEDRAATTQTFLHHRFPASDIPQPARELYLRNQVRFIYDSEGDSSALYPNVSPYQKGAVDLSDSRLRGVPPVHLEYLRNMGVKTSFSVAVTVHGRLWGLIACHSMSKVYVPHLIRSLCETLSHTAAVAIPLLEQSKHQAEVLTFRGGIEKIFRGLRFAEDPVATLFRELDAVNEVFRSGGFALVNETDTQMIGLTLGSQDLRALYSVLLQKMRDEKLTRYSTDSLRDLLPELSESQLKIASGILCVRASKMEETILIWFRPEYLLEIQWGGDPRKITASRNYQGPINPRASFESWTEVIKGRSQPWRDYEEDGALFVKEFLFDVLVTQKRLIQELTANRSPKP